MLKGESMDKKIVALLVGIALLLIASCGMFPFGNSPNTITPSDTIITESRNVSGFTGIDFGTFGSVVISQGSTESLKVTGPDNVVPLVETSVQDGVLHVDMKENINLRSLNAQAVLKFQVGVQDLKDLTVSGLGEVSMDGLDTSTFNLTLSGAGATTIDNMTLDQLKVTISGLGGATLSGTATNADVTISGAGKLTAPDLEIQTASVSIPGLGGATVWVTDSLTGTISGAGNVEYYGSPQTHTSSTGLGQFQSLGAK
jgi:hypothetical protein